MKQACIKAAATSCVLGRRRFGLYTVGLTLVELLVAMFILGIVLTVALQLFSGSSQLISSDTKRVTSSRETQAAVDLMVADLRQAGENFNSVRAARKLLSGIEFSNIADEPNKKYKYIRITNALSRLQGKDLVGFEGSYREFAPMRVCGALDSNNFIMADSSAPTSICVYDPLLKPPTMMNKSDDQKLALLRHLLKLKDNTPLSALIYDFNPSDSKANATIANKITIVGVNEPVYVPNSDPTIIVPEKMIGTIKIKANTLPSLNTISNYMILPVEQREYFLQDGNLMFIDGSRESELSRPQVLLFNVKNMDIRTVVKTAAGGEAIISQLEWNQPQRGDTWRSIARIEITVDTWKDSSKKKLGASYKATVVPRNVESANSF